MFNFRRKPTRATLNARIQELTEEVEQLRNQPAVSAWLSPDDSLRVFVDRRDRCPRTYRVRSLKWVQLAWRSRPRIVDAVERDLANRYGYERLGLGRFRCHECGDEVDAPSRACERPCGALELSE